MQQVLKLLAESGLALTPCTVFRNLKMRGATFTRRTLSNYLSELLEDGLIQKISPDNGDPLYQITPDGMDYIQQQAQN